MLPSALVIGFSLAAFLGCIYILFRAARTVNVYALSTVLMAGVFTAAAGLGRVVTVFDFPVLAGGFALSTALLLYTVAVERFGTKYGMTILCAVFLGMVVSLAGKIHLALIAASSQFSNVSPVDIIGEANTYLAAFLAFYSVGTMTIALHRFRTLKSGWMRVMVPAVCGTLVGQVTVLGMLLSDRFYGLILNVPLFSAFSIGAALLIPTVFGAVIYYRPVRPVVAPYKFGKYL